MTPAQAVSRFPPSFDGNPWTYGFALFSLTLVSAVSAAILVRYALEARQRREIDVKIHNALARPRLPRIISVHRLIVSGLLLTILIGAFPDVLILLAWGEASDGTMEILFAIDRVGDGLVVFPFVAAAVLSTWIGQVLDHRIALDASAITMRMSVSQLRERARMVAIVFLIALGVTLAKSVA